MGSMAKKIAKNKQQTGVKLQQLKEKKAADLNKKVMAELEKAFFEGFSKGAQEQQEADAKALIDFFSNLESIEGIGKKTAWKVKEAFMQLAEKKEQAHGHE